MLPAPQPFAWLAEADRTAFWEERTPKLWAGGTATPRVREAVSMRTVGVDRLGVGREELTIRDWALLNPRKLQNPAALTSSLSQLEGQVVTTRRLRGVTGHSNCVYFP